MKRRTRAGRLTALASVLLSLTCASAGRAAEPGLVPDLNWGISVAEQKRTAAAIADVGARWVRLNVQWKYWEPDGPLPGIGSGGVIAATERSVDLARAAGAKVLVMVYNAPDWAAVRPSRDGQVPRRPRDFAHFVRKLAAHFRGKVEAYEIWNEPDIDRFWSGGRDPAAYTRLLKASYPAVKAGDANAEVVFGGLSWDYTRPANFLTRAYDAGAKGFFDVMAVHPYPETHSDPYLTRWQSWFRQARRSMLARGDDKPIWLTEFGINTSSRAYDPANGVWQAGVSKARQALLLSRAFTLAEQDPYVGAIFYYNFRNNYWGNDDPTSIEDTMGLMRTDFTRKPAYYAFRNYAARSDAGRANRPGGPRPRS